MPMKITIERVAFGSRSRQEKALRKDEGQAINSGEEEAGKENRLALLTRGG
jgi:hypothetical protein